MQPKKKMTSLGCAAYCALLLFWPLLVGLASAGISSAFGSSGGWRSWLFSSGMGWRSYVLLAVLLECLWLVQAFRGAKSLLAWHKREQEERDRQREASPEQ